MTTAGADEGDGTVEPAAAPVATTGSAARAASPARSDSAAVSHGGRERHRERGVTCDHGGCR